MNRLMLKWGIIVTCVSLFGGLFLINQNRAKAKEMETKSKKEIYLAGGCFWGTQEFVRQIRGVTSTEVGYANSNKENPSYEEVCTGKTNATETVKVCYDPKELDLPVLLKLYFKTIDPTSLNRQGNDVGTQYRTGIYYTEGSDLAAIQLAVKELEAQIGKSSAIEVSKLQNFFLAEEKHQAYLQKNPQGYCHIEPGLFELAKKGNPKYEKPGDEKLKKELSPMQYDVTQKSATEPPFKNEFWDEKREGIYVDITTGEPLFLSSDKFDSGCGWPSFSKPIEGHRILEKRDLSHGMQRVEVRSKSGDAHLGHVFTDGPKKSGGLRYCINSASLKFIPKEKMKEMGYGEYISLIK